MKKKIAYCPTMKPFADKITDSLSDTVEMVEMASAAQVLGALRTGSVDGVLIGRYAKQMEIDSDIKREILKEGYTLVYKVKSGIPAAQLKELTVRTYLDKSELKDFVPLFGTIEYFDTLDECLDGGFETPVIINWKDYRDDLELLIPLEAYGKVPLFRAPVLYYRDIDSGVVESIGSGIKI